MYIIDDRIYVSQIMIDSGSVLLSPGCQYGMVYWYNSCDPIEVKKYFELTNVLGFGFRGVQGQSKGSYIS